MVEFLTGKREIHSFGKESTYGTQASSINRFFGKNTELNAIRDDADFLEVVNAGSGSLDVEAYETGIKRFGGEIKSNPQEWRILEYVLGQVGTTGSNPYTHTFTNVTTLPSFTYERAKKATTDSVYRYLGCKVDSYNLEWNASGSNRDKMLTESIKFVGQNLPNPGTSATSITPPTTDAFKARHIKFTLNTTEVVECLSGNVMISNKLHDPLYANSTTGTLIGEPTPQMRTVSGTIRVLEKDNTFINLFEQYAEVSGTNKIDFIRGTNDTLTYTFTGLVLDGVISESNLENFNVVDLGFRARSVTAVAVDAISSY